MHDRRLRILQCEENGTAKGAGNRWHEQLRNRVHRSCKERCENRSENEYDFVNGGFHGVCGVQQFAIAGAVEHVRPAGTHERAERKLRKTHHYGQHEQQWNRHAHQCGECETEHGDDLHDKYHRTDLTLAESVEQSRVQWRDRCGGEHICGAHHACDRPIVVQVVECENNAEAHHRHRQSRQSSGSAERFGSRNGEQYGIWRLRGFGCAGGSHAYRSLTFVASGTCARPHMLHEGSGAPPQRCT